jgi:hypothetical protein
MKPTSHASRASSTSRASLASFGLAVALLGLALALLVGGAGAQTMSIRPHAEDIRPGHPMATPVPRTHVVAGTIAKVSGRELFVELRSRRLVHVDASPAIASGRYSDPLFVGKVIVIEGTYARDGTLVATSITRLPRIDETVPLDR